MRNELAVSSARRSSRALSRILALLALTLTGFACADEAPVATRIVGAAEHPLSARAASEPAAGNTPVATPAGQARYRALADRLDQELHASGVPGGALAIVERGRLRFAAGLGVKRAGDPEPVDADTRFRIGSITKTFTAAVAAQLASERVLSLDAPITRHVPELKLHAPHDPRSLTLRQLLSHTAGVPDHVEWECDTDREALGRWFAAHPNLTLWSPPGRLWNYSNLGYALAGLTLERAAGVPYRQLVDELIFAPLGLRSMTFDTETALAGNHASAHTSETSFDYTTTACALLEPVGYLWSSAPDLARFAEVLLSDGRGVLDARALRQLRSRVASTQLPPDAYYGLGLAIFSYRGIELVGHDGGMPGFRSALLMAPQRGAAVVLLVNGDDFEPTSHALTMIAELLELPDETPKDWSTPPSDWQRYVGVYAQPDDTTLFPEPQLGTVSVELEDDELYAHILDSDERFPMRQLTRDAWLVAVDGAEIVVTFFRDQSGRAEYLATRLGVAKRVRDAL